MALKDSTISNQIYLSRDQIRNQMTDYVKQFLELENVDLTKSSFVSYLIDIFSILSSNLLFYQSSVYNEFFLPSAKLPNSIYNLSAFIGYEIQDAEYSTASLLMTFPLTFGTSSVSIDIPSGFEFKAGSIPFKTYYDTSITVTNNSSVSIYGKDEYNREFSIPVLIDSTSATPTFRFLLNTRQYTTSEQEFQIDSDLIDFQFITLDVPLTGQVSELEVLVIPPGKTEADGVLYTEYSSIFLMKSDTYGYVSRRTGTGRRLYFGNDIMGKRPDPSSSVIVTITETEGEDGNVISGSIKTGPRLYTTEGGVTKIVNYTVINASPATGGTDEESLEDIKVNAIDNLVSMHRLVSEQDYKNTDVVITTAPLGANPIPVLKRSDVRINEIQLYSMMLFGDEIVPTRSVWTAVPIPSPDSTSVEIARGTTITYDGRDYYCLFDIHTDNIYNRIAYYEYAVHSVSVVPDPVSGYELLLQPDANMSLNNFIISKVGSNATFEIPYTSTDPNSDLYECVMSIRQMPSYTWTLTNDPVTKKFTGAILYSLLKEGQLEYSFDVFTDLGNKLSEYQASAVLKMDLSSFMLSNIQLTTDSTSVPNGYVIIYDIPVVDKIWYDALGTTGQSDFETLVLQKTITGIDFESYRMATDFTNLKYLNTVGNMRNMSLNTITDRSVRSLNLKNVPTPADGLHAGYRYIVSGVEGGSWTGYKNYFAECITINPVVTWRFSQPVTEDIVYVTDQDKKFIYTEYGWIEPVFTIPLQIELEVFRSINYFDTDAALIDEIKTTLVTTFQNRFSADLELYRSEIIDVVQSVVGVEHCRLLHPYSSIFFNFSLEDFTQDQLLKYNPEYIYFTEDDISIRIFRG